MKKLLILALLFSILIPFAANAATSTTVTLANNNKTVNIFIGDTLTVKLGSTYNWSLKLSNQKVLQRVPNVMLMRGAQGMFRGKTTGYVILTATGEPLCRKSKPACAAPSKLFKLKVGVKPAPPKPVTTTTVSVSSSAPVVAGCQIFPNDNPWNQDISKLPVRSDSAKFIRSIGTDRKLHPDFGSNQTYGIPFSVVEKSQPKVPITFTAYGDESDPGPYPIPTNVAIEGGSNSTGDRHVLVLQKESCILYEMYNSHKTANGWSADSAAFYDLRSNKLRPEKWTSADAAGLPIFPGLIKYDEVASGEIKHAIRFTTSRTQKGYIHPAVHFAGSNNSDLPPMGLRVRLKADYDISKLTGASKVIATAMKKYGMILADNGSPWFFQGATDPRWNDEDLNQLKAIPGSAFEAVDTGQIIH